jgi:hypothetical protein
LLCPDVILTLEERMGSAVGGEYDDASKVRWVEEEDVFP